MGTAILGRLALVLTLLFVVACGPDRAGMAGVTTGPTPVIAAPPSPTTPAPSPAAPVRLGIVNGWTGAPVTGAAVTLNGVVVPVDGAGQFEVPAATSCLRATVVARGFLERSLSCLPIRGTVGGTVLTLWPVENDAEREALREFAFSGGRTMLQFFGPLPVSFEGGAGGPMVEAWQQAAARLRAETSWSFTLEIDASGTRAIDEGVIAMPTTSSVDCTGSWSRWSYDVSRFCLDPGEHYFLGRARIDSAVLGSPTTALRVLMSYVGFRPHGLPGAFNATRPADDGFSDFERRTFHMITLRARETLKGTDWPDSER